MEPPLLDILQNVAQESQYAQIKILQSVLMVVLHKNQVREDNLEVHQEDKPEVPQEDKQGVPQEDKLEAHLEDLVVNQEVNQVKVALLVTNQNVVIVQNLFVRMDQNLKKVRMENHHALINLNQCAKMDQNHRNQLVDQVDHLEVLLEDLVENHLEVLLEDLVEKIVAPWVTNQNAVMVQRLFAKTNQNRKKVQMESHHALINLSHYVVMDKNLRNLQVAVKVLDLEVVELVKKEDVKINLSQLVLML